MLGQKRMGSGLFDQSQSTQASPTRKQYAGWKDFVVKAPEVGLRPAKRPKLVYRGEGGLFGTVRGNLIAINLQVIPAWSEPFVTVGTGAYSRIALPEYSDTLYPEHCRISLVEERLPDTPLHDGPQSFLALHFHVMTLGGLIKIQRGGQTWIATRGNDETVPLNSHMPMDIYMSKTNSSASTPFRFWPTKAAQPFGHSAIPARASYLLEADYDLSAAAPEDNRLVRPPRTALVTVTSKRQFYASGGNWRHQPAFVEHDCLCAVLHAQTGEIPNPAAMGLPILLDTTLPTFQTAVVNGYLYSPVIITKIDLVGAVHLPVAVTDNRLREPLTFNRLSGQVWEANWFLQFGIPGQQYYLKNPSSDLVYLTHPNPALADVRIVRLDGVTCAESGNGANAAAGLMYYIAGYGLPRLGPRTTALNRYQLAAHRPYGNVAIPGSSDGFIKLMVAAHAKHDAEALIKLLRDWKLTDWWKASQQLVEAIANPQPEAVQSGVDGSATPPVAPTDDSMAPAANNAATTATKGYQGGETAAAMHAAPAVESLGNGSSPDPSPSGEAVEETSLAHVPSHPQIGSFLLNAAPLDDCGAASVERSGDILG